MIDHPHFYETAPAQAINSDDWKSTPIAKGHSIATIAFNGKFAA
jgi:hypothetical protein